MYVGSYNIYGHSMSQPLPYDEIRIDRDVKIDDIIKTSDDSDVGYFVEVHIKYLDEMKQKTKFFFVLFCE